MLVAPRDEPLGFNHVSVGARSAGVDQKSAPKQSPRIIAILQRMYRTYISNCEPAGKLRMSRLYFLLSIRSRYVAIICNIIAWQASSAQYKTLMLCMHNYL